ncbi:MAG TPA: hypothetical protein PK523_01570 [Elusimicrobiales bacterium]|nr:hypothetical protein [Elusimicrobiales bacterium]
MNASLFSLFLLAAPPPAAWGVEPPAGGPEVSTAAATAATAGTPAVAASTPAVAASTAAVTAGTAALSGPELKRLRNSEIAALRKKQEAELKELEVSLRDKPPGEAGRARRRLRAAHREDLSRLKARHAAGAGPRAGKPGPLPPPAGK